MAALLTINLIVLAVGAWICIFRVIPSLVVSSSRYRLWEIRDALVDEISGDVYRDPEPAQRLAKATEDVILVVPQITPLKAWWLLRLARRERIRFDPDPLRIASVAYLPDRERLQAWHEGIGRVVIRRAVLGSPSGWLLGALVFFRVSPKLIGRLFHGGEMGGLIKSELREEVTGKDLDSFVGLLSRNGRDDKRLRTAM